LTGIIPLSEHARTEFVGLSVGAQTTYIRYEGAGNELFFEQPNQFYLAGATTNKPIYKSDLSTNNIIYFQLQMQAKNSSGTLRDYARMNSWILERTDGSEEGQIEFLVLESGSLTSYVTIDGEKAAVEFTKPIRNPAGEWIIGATGDALFADIKGTANFIVERRSTAISTTSSSEVIIGITDTSIARTITMQTIDTIDGQIYIIKDESGGAATNNIEIDTQGSETIDGAASILITVNFGVLRLYSDGTNWFTF
jgi:hypothetical protein